VAMLLKGKVQILVLNRERKKGSFWRADLWLLKERIKTVCDEQKVREKCTLSGVLSAWWVPREFPSLACFLSSVVVELGFLIHHLQKKAKRWESVCCGLSGAIQNRSRFVAANLDSNHRLVAFWVFRGVLCLFFEQN
jgi:hypothetical protein